jgi:hypothetical protein
MQLGRSDKGRMLAPRQSAHSPLLFLVLWSAFSGVIMFLGNIWLPGFIGPVGLVIGFITITLPDRLKIKNAFVYFIFPIASFFLIAGFSIALLSLSCQVQVISPQYCSNQSRESFLLANLFVAVPIIPICLFVYVPRLVYRMIKPNTGLKKLR